jgi:hypothetical protein
MPCSNQTFDLRLVTTEIKANNLTKALLIQKYREFRKQIALVDIIDKITGSGLEPSFGKVD